MPVLSMFYGIIIRMQSEKVALHEDELKANWLLLSKGEGYFKIEPLK